MNIQMARFKVKAEKAKEFEDAAEAVFKAVEKKRPKGVRYTLCRLSDGFTYLGLLELEDGIANPLPELPEGKKFLEGLQNWTVEPAIRDELTPVGSYGSF